MAATARAKAGRPTRPTPSARRLRGDPDHPTALARLAAIHSRRNRPAELVDDCAALIDARPDHFEARHRRGEALAFLGAYEESADDFREAVRRMPGSPSAHNGLGVALARLGPRTRRSLASTWRSGSPRGWPRRGTTWGDSTATSATKQASPRSTRPSGSGPTSPGAQQPALVLNSLRRFDRAMEACERALAIEPEHVDARKNLAMIRLVQGDYARGWPEYRWRWRLDAMPMPDHPRPLWRGEPLVGKTILLWAEQGVGDLIQFLRFARPVKDCGAAGVVVHCPEAMAPLVRTCPGVDRVEAGPEVGIRLSRPDDGPAGRPRDDRRDDPVGVPVPRGGAGAGRAVARTDWRRSPGSPSASSGRGTRRTPSTGRGRSRSPCSNPWPGSRGSGS